ncbi:NADPH-dependent FMN reductase [Longispora albida]|uniref:NADPH-dependent FMN reductase n=1 Tax=Longispora albida TaxID=203523 RepID=UPI000366ACB4|nr:NAD(P)H-dependent oxidoreductase [Longispora albida]
MTAIAFIAGSIRHGRRSRLVADWAAGVSAEERTGLHCEVVDLADAGLPAADGPRLGPYGGEYTQRWSETVSRFDGFVFVTPEAGHAVTGALGTALDLLYAEWNDKAAGLISYGLHGRTGATETLRATLAGLRVETVQPQVGLSLLTDFQIESPAHPGTVTPARLQRLALLAMLDEVIATARALGPVRAVRMAAAA